MDGGEANVASLPQQLNDAAEQGNIERVRALLDQGVAVDSRSAFQNTPLLLASHRGHTAVAALLLDAGANINAMNGIAMTPVKHASSEGHLDTLRLLVSKGADIHRKTQNGAPLILAAQRDQLPVCEYLLSLGADLMEADAFRRTALTAYGSFMYRPSSETKALRCAALEAAWAAGPHPSQVQRRRDECWARRGPLITVLAEHAYRPLQLRAWTMHVRLVEEENFMLRRHIAVLTVALSAGSALPPLPVVVVQTSRVQDVFRNEGLVRHVVSFL